MTTRDVNEPDWKADARAVSQLAPTGKLRVAINFGNPVLAQRDPTSGEPRGVSADLANGLAQRVGLEIEFLHFDTAGKVADSASDNVWDLAFLAIDPLRAEKIQYTDPYVLIEGTYLVRADSRFHSVKDMDAPGVQIAVGKGAAYDLFLSRTLTQASIVRLPLSEDAIEQFAEMGLDAAAGVRQPLAAHAAAHPGYRVLEDRFTVIKQAMGCPRGREAGARLVARYLDFAKKSGLITDGLRRSGQGDATTA